MKLLSSPSIAAVFAVALATASFAQADGPRRVTLDAAATAVERVKAKYFDMDFIGGVREGDRLLQQFPKSRELAAWRIANLSRTESPAESEAAANALIAATHDDPWGWFAKTFVAEYGGLNTTAPAVLAASLEAYRRAPANPTIVWLRAFAYSNNRQPEKALAMIDSAASRGPLSQEMRALRATAMYNAATPGAKTDRAKADSAFRLYASARENDPSDVTANVLAASRLMSEGRYADAYPLAKRGVELSPVSLTAHQTYWRAIDGGKERSQAQRDSEALADAEVLLRLRGNEPIVLASVADQFRARHLADRAQQLEDRILTEAPDSYQAEWVLVKRYRAIDDQRRDPANKDSSLTPRYQQALWAFLERPKHSNDRLVGDAYRQLFYLMDSTTDADTLLRVVRGMVKYEGINPHVVYADGAIRLAERGRDFKEAEQIARDGINAGKAKIDEQRYVYETVGDYARAVDWMSAFMYDALGVVYMRQGRLDEADRELTHARELDPKSLKAFYHLGQLAEKRGRLDDAEQFYIKGSLLGTPSTNLNRVSLQRLYKTRKGSLDGYDAYLGAMAETDRSNRRADVAKSRVASPRPLEAFHLRTLDGSPFSPDSLRGKTTVINNWGMWCGPCVAEMPEYQKLAEQFAADTTVRILTIDNDPNTDELRTWLAKKAYTFTTLIDDGYLSRSNVHTFPTTWFVDPSGRVVFTKTGWSEKLVEEFTWRIEMIRKP